MNYHSVKSAVFINRPNRFLAHVLLEDKEEIVHVRNTGRCKEILYEGARVILEKASNQERKTAYSLIGVYKGEILINIDSQIPNAVIYQGIIEGGMKEFPDIVQLNREVVYGNSRFDLAFERKDRKGFIEVKGVTLEEEGVALFPDAPTQRGTKHVKEMIKAVEDGYEGYLIFLIQMKGIDYFTPNKIRDPEFAHALALAKEKGVKLLAYDSIVQEDGIILGDPVRIRLAAE